MTSNTERLRLMWLALFGALVLAGGAGKLYGQTQKGTILGTITDSSGAVIPAAQVVITETGTNVARTTPTNESGFFAFPNLDPGRYRVEVEHTGFQKLTRSGIELAADTTIRVDVEMTPGASTQTIEVTAETPELKTDRADTGGTIQQEVQNLPTLNNRNYQNLIMLLPGVQIGYRSGSAFYNSQEHIQSVVNGLDRLNNYLIEGVDNNVESFSGIIPPADSIQSVDVTTSNYDPEFGRAGGAVTNVILKSGTNDFHGDLFEYHRDGVLQARSAFASSVPHTLYNQYGGTFGGRIKRNKLFFFGDYQGTRNATGFSNLPTIPTMAFRTGDLSASPTIIYDPRTGNANGAGRMPFTGNLIPDNRISTIAKQLLSFIPPPNRPGLSSNFAGDTIQRKTIEQYDSKIDYLITVNDRVSVRYSYQSANVFDPGLYGPGGGIYGGPHSLGFSGSGPSLNQSPGLNYSHIFSSTLVTEVRFGVVRNRNDAINIDTGLNTTKNVGIPGVNLGDPWTSGLTDINIAGYDAPLVGFNSSLPWHRAVTNFDVVNNWTKVKGTHVMKWGVNFIRERQDLEQTRGVACCTNPRGQFTFTAGPTSLNGNSKNGFANAFAAFLLDQPNTIGAAPTPSIFPARRNSDYALYFQDKWQVKRKLTVDMGIRWEYSPSSTPHFPGGFSNYILSNNTLELAGIGSIPMNLGISNNLAKSWAPRFGLAYRLDEKTVFRGGFGISYLPHVTYDYNYPVLTVIELDPINSFGVAGSMATGLPPAAPVVAPASGIITNPPLNYVYTTIPKNYFHSYVESWNFAIQRALPSNFSVEAAYVGNHGVDIGDVQNYNASRIPGSGTASEPLNILFHRTAETDLGGNNGGGLGESSEYEAFQARLNRRFSGGFVLTTSYAFSKAIDYNSSTSPGATPGTTFNNINLNANRGLSTWNRPNVLTQSGTYELPFGQGKRWAKSGPAKVLVGGWQVSGLWTWENGIPLDIQISATSLNAPGNGNRPNVNGPVQIYGAIGPGQLYFDTSMFSAPAPNTFGNVGRNILHGPGIFEIDISLVRKFHITERISLDFRVDSFDTNNGAHYDNPGTTFGNANFGQVTTDQGTQNVAVQVSRQWQFSLKLAF